MTRIRTLLAALLVSALALTGLTGCGGGDVTYAPAAYGEVIGGIGHCYYVQDPAEVTYLYGGGLCPHTWVATLAPVYWHERYFSYYDSPAYYTHYVPVGSRTVFISTQRTFYSSYRVQISSQSRYASYRGSNGRTYTGTKVGSTKFGSGSSFGSAGQRYGGGSRGGSGSGSGYSGRSGSGGSGSRGSGGGFSGGFGGGSRRN